MFAGASDRRWSITIAFLSLALRLGHPALSARLLKYKKLRDLHTQRRGKVLKPGDGWRVYAALHQADELDRAADSFGKLRLRQLPCLSEFRNSPSKFLLKHGAGIPDAGANGNGAKLRVVPIRPAVAWTALMKQPRNDGRYVGGWAPFAVLIPRRL